MIKCGIKLGKLRGIGMIKLQLHVHWQIIQHYYIKCAHHHHPTYIDNIIGCPPYMIVCFWSVLFFCHFIEAIHSMFIEAIHSMFNFSMTNNIAHELLELDGVGSVISACCLQDLSSNFPQFLIHSLSSFIILLYPFLKIRK